MAITAQKQLTPTWWTPPTQEKEAKPARFKIRPLSGAEQMECYDHFSPNQQRILSPGIRIAIGYGLVDWENVLDEKGEPLECKPENMGYLPLAIQNPLGNHIIALSHLGEEETKNSE